MATKKGRQRKGRQRKAMIIEIIVGATIYTASFLGCYDGDTCKVKLHNPPDLVETIQHLRFEGFDTPERHGALCANEQRLALEARTLTLDYMQNTRKVVTRGKRDKYGRLLVEAPVLKATLFTQGLAVEYYGDKKNRKAWWCNG